ncbi:hypothetical protein I4J42_00240 [Corynebacterium belfantii]|uniref:hypothetical protein n=1 Tax=Corynebacterium belfantii TaxID=2014537 RepID=UPI0018D4B66A|nr:hypothetical protein [Corynebacterium belfantii]MBG9332333.1 hypothetical protein [Corynebacterium belfantii]
MISSPKASTWRRRQAKVSLAQEPRLPLAPLLEKPIPAWFWPGVPEEPPIPFDYTVIARTPDLLVVDKPCFLPATSNGRIVAETV